MDPIEPEVVATPSLEHPVLLEGLPGIGLVGKLAVDHLVEELDSEPVRRIYSEHLPPAVSVDDAGSATLACLTLHAIEPGGRDLLVLTGESQAQESVGQYRMADAVLDIAEDFGVDDVITIGGFGTGEQIEDYAVVGAVGSGGEGLKERLADAGAGFEDQEAPDNIVGMSGVLVGVGALRGFETAGLLGLTPGFHVDPASARAVLEVLQEGLGFSVSLDTLEQQAEEIQNLLDEMRERQQQPTGQGGEDLRYIG